MAVIARVYDKDAIWVELMDVDYSLNLNYQVNLS